MKKLSPKEEAIMACFWQHGPMFVKEVLDKMDEPKPHFNTVSTFIRSLESKGWLGHETIGNSYRYFPTVDSSEWREKSIGGFVDKFFGKSYLRFVSSLVKDEKISTEELRELIDMIEKNSSKNDNG
ncbi:MAG: BlaI/MecI/CopY family transcriptional regulator [Muribaculaceae bacterium]|nr:BlaI/MecI/CopY family transcriptional regulator [Muribaculaceae bacterium]